MAYVSLGHHIQRIYYEGMNHICFLCGKIGYKNIACQDFKTYIRTSQVNLQINITEHNEISSQPSTNISLSRIENSAAPPTQN